MTTTKFTILLQLFLACCFIIPLPGLYTQSVIKYPDGEMTIRFDDGTERTVVPSDSILYSSAFEEITEIERKESEYGNLIVDHSLGVDYSSVAVRVMSNKIHQLQKDLKNYRSEKLLLQEELEYARANPGRIRPTARMELSDRFNYVVNEIGETQQKITRSEKELAYLKRLRHQDILKNLSVRRVLPLPHDYDFGNVRMRQFESNRIEEKSPAMEWKAPEDIPMPILPHPSTAEITDLYRNPPERICRIRDYGQSVFEDQVHIETERELLFFMIPEEMRIHLRGRPMISCDVNAGRRGPGVFLNFHFTLHIPSARRSFGGLPENTPIRIRLLNGEIINLHNIRSDSGSYDERSNTVSFTAITALSRRNEVRLKKHEIDQIRVVWFSGFEDYEVYDINLIRDQLNCLDSHLINQ